MALFGKLFEKKVCSVCGGEIGLLGNRKLSDGNCCKRCAGKLSRWFEDRRESTAAQIKAQIAYRERNAEELKSFDVSEVIGEYEKMYIEKVNGVPTRFFVASESDYLDENPDIISLLDVLSCTADIDEYEEEIMREDKDGEMVSYNPPRYQYRYNFYINMVIRDNPYFDTIRFNVNDNDVTLETVKGGSSLGGRNGSAGAPLRSVAANREASRYDAYEQMCRKICQTVEDAKCGVKEQEAAEAEKKAARPAFCPACGAPADGGQFCSFCGSRLG